MRASRQQPVSIANEADQFLSPSYKTGVLAAKYGTKLDQDDSSQFRVCLIGKGREKLFLRRLRKASCAGG